MQPTYIHDHPDWPQFHRDNTALTAKLAAVRLNQGRLLGRMEALGFEQRQTTVLEAMTEEVQKSSEIEGEMLNRESVRSSIARRLGIDKDNYAPSDRRVEGIVEMTLDATLRFGEPLTEDRIFGWHASLFPTGYSGLHRITVGAWRTDEKGPMQVVSGSVGRERVHYAAPAAGRLEQEMSAFLHWFETEDRVDPVLKAGMAHVWFVLIHPFDDGNGRIARTITEMSLARAENSAQRYYSMSAQIRRERQEYYGILDRTGKGDLDITAWLFWFLECLDRAIECSHASLAAALHKSQFWDSIRTLPLNDRQQKMINRLLDGFEGKLTTTKWAKITRTSQDTAYRDILDLVSQGILARGPEGGRSTSYVLAENG